MVKLDALPLADVELDMVGQLLIELQSVGQPEIRCMSRDANQIWYRAVECDDAEGFANLRRCLYRNNEGTLLGRANLPLAPAFYASWNAHVAISEIQPTTGKYVQVVAVRPCDNLFINCQTVGDLFSIWNGANSLVGADKSEEFVRSADPSSSLMPSVLFDAFLSQKFSKLVYRGQEHEHKITAVFAHHILRTDQFGIMYPAVRKRGGLNISMSPSNFDNYFEVLWVALYRVLDDFGFGMYSHQFVKRSAEFESDGDIVWGSRGKLVPTTYTPTAGFRLSAPYAGWRVPKPEAS